ncbi:hypothetical protein [Alteromonas lipolytica]|uniref:TonB-dependent receptor-like beta-barrel domain-containing protein n=1 Tax=Alteromonas lipolytica TaxID=1856405 RepID=A0A1E8FDZ7_9ALTE|nr:hypothetical protein [Alteromonas lipolytica]OFI33986.1 hypothetical protein BFC17_20745 [Alteromonas lipolytica]GGF66598.1 hypothetical protein GCM10011338_18500 [Alteromonas lipolytica]
MAYSQTDFTLTYHFANNRLSMTGFITNLENESRKSNVFVSPGFLGLSATTGYTRPRTIGLKIDYLFE